MSVDLGQVVGESSTPAGSHAFLWTAAGGMVDLGTLGGAGSRTQAEGINDAGQIVGLFNDNDNHAFYWTAAGGWIEFPTLSGIESGARVINDAGQIAGFGDISTGDAHAVVWNSASDPATPEEGNNSLEGSIFDLVAAGRLQSGQATGLTRPLQNALRSLARGGSPLQALNSLISRRRLHGRSSTARSRLKTVMLSSKRRRVSERL